MCLPAFNSEQTLVDSEQKMNDEPLTKKERLILFYSIFMPEGRTKPPLAPSTGFAAGSVLNDDLWHKFEVDEAVNIIETLRQKGLLTCINKNEHRHNSDYAVPSLAVYRNIRSLLWRERLRFWCRRKVRMAFDFTVKSVGVILVAAVTATITSIIGEIIKKHFK